MDLWGSLIENSTIHQPVRQQKHSSYIVLRKVGRNNSVSNCPSTEDLEPLTSSKRKRRVVYGCKHFPEVEAKAKANWSCEFCGGARLIEHATRSNEVVLSLEINELLVREHTTSQTHDDEYTFCKVLIKFFLCCDRICQSYSCLVMPSEWIAMIRVFH